MVAIATPSGRAFNSKFGLMAAKKGADGLRSKTRANRRPEAPSEASQAWRNRYWLTFVAVVGLVSVFGLNWWITLPASFVGSYVVVALSPFIQRIRVRVEVVLVAGSLVFLAALAGYSVRHLLIGNGVDVPSIAVGSSESVGTVSHTWTDPRSAGGREGPSISTGQTVVVSCKVTGFQVADGNQWWYRIASPPWSGQYYASADAFYNNGSSHGTLHGTPFVDPKVPDCSSGVEGEVRLVQRH